MKYEKLTGPGDEHLFIHPTSKRIYVRLFRAEFGEIFKSTKTKDKKKARQKRDEYLRALFAKEETSKLSDTALMLFDQWISRKQIAGKSPGTITSIQASRKFLEPYFAEMLSDEITALWWETVFIPETKRKGFDWEGNEIRRESDRKFFNDRKWLNSFLLQLKEDGVLKRVPKLINPDGPRKPGKVYTNKEVQKLIKNAGESLRLPILMAATMGMRRGEIFGLKCDRVDLDRKVISLQAEDTKIRKARSLAISPKVFPELVKRMNSGSIYVFHAKDSKYRPVHKDGFYTAWGTLKKNQKIVGRFHDLRHTFLTNAFKAPGANAALICHYAGLSLEVAVRTYLHFDENDSRKVAQLVTYV